MKKFREYIQQTTNEGALSHEGLYWIDPEGKKFLVNSLGNDTKLSHEDWANENDYDLEKMFDDGWIRVQALTPTYLMIDHKKATLGRSQSDSLLDFFEERYNRMILERANNKVFDLNGSPYVSNEDKEQGFDFIRGKIASPTRY